MKPIKYVLALGLLCAAALVLAIPVNAQADVVDEEIVTEAYIYLLGRALVIRQEHLDIDGQGLPYNEVHHNPLASVDFVNPNMSVTNSQLWIAVDNDTPVLLEIPKIERRYYTAQICDEWGEVITNINPRNYPLQPYGKFAFVAPGYTGEIPEDAVRIELRSPIAKMLARVELQDDRDGAVALQRQITATPLGEPDIREAVDLPLFDNTSLIGVELFDRAEEILVSAPDVSPIAAQMQAKVLTVARQAADPAKREAIEALLRDTVIPDFVRFAVTEAGATRNNWLGTLVIGNYGEDYRIRTAANLVGIWANAHHEVVYHVTTVDAEGMPLDGSNQYVLHFPQDALPKDVVNEFWSLTLVSLPDFRPVPNDLDRYALSTWSSVQKETDGSLKLLVAPQPVEGIPVSNWLPSPDGQPFSLTFRSYVPKSAVQTGEWFPPAVEKVK